MVLQRQVPARPVAKTGEAATGADATADSRNGAFSAALSQEKRGAVAERDKIGSQEKKAADETDVEAEGNEPADEAMSGPAQSDDILDLLAGLGSGAVNAKPVESEEAEQTIEPGEAELAIEPGKAELAVEPGAELAVGPGKAKLADSRQDAASTGEKNVLAHDAAADVSAGADPAKPGAANLRNGDDDQARAVGARVAQVEAKQALGEAVQPGAATPAAGGVPASEGPVATVRASAVSPAAVVSVAATGMMGKGAQAPTTDAGQDRQREPSTVKEVIRALGLGGGSGSAEPDVSESRSRGRNAGRQSGAEYRQTEQTEERVGSKGGKIEVIESRRFMPVQAVSANTQLLTRSLAEASSTALAAQKLAPAQPAALAGPSQPAHMLHTLKLQLNPVSLGSVTAVLKLTGETLSVEIKVETAEAYRQLKDDNQSILKALRGQGFGVEQITVQHVAGPDRSAGQAPQQGFLDSQQGAESNGAQSSGKDSGRNKAGQRESGPQGGQGHEQSTYAVSGAVRTDGVYL